MLVVRAIFNSTCEDVLAFKTCCGLRAFDQNLEIHARNQGDRPVVVPSHLDLEGEMGTQRVSNLMPYGGQTIPPGELRAFYCTLDEQVWSQAKRLVLFDESGTRYPVEIDHTGDKTE